MVSSLRPTRKTKTRIPIGKGLWRFALLQIAFAVLPQLTPSNWVPTGVSLPGPKSAQAAERIIFSLGATIERGISVKSLEVYAKDGIVTAELAPYIKFIERRNPGALEQFRTLLTRRADIDVVAVDQFGNTPQGDFLLMRAGEVFQTGARLSGKKGLRGAAITAAADEANGLTLLNVVQQFPTPVLRVDIQRGLSLLRRADRAFNQANIAIDLVEQLSFQLASEPFPTGVSAAELNNLVTLPGPFLINRLSLRLKATGKPVELYIPESPTARLFKLPAVVISHGVGSDRASYDYLARFLAAHGFVAINIEHPGSSAEQLNSFLAGRATQIPDDEFINRPQLISEVLDALSARASINKNLDIIDFNNVGIIGQSFGGYTALAAAGAPINLASLRDTCPPDFSPNISLLLQCQAVAIAPPDKSSLLLQDRRIQAVVAINPLTSAIFGPDSLSQIDVPVLMMAGTADTVTPALPEQILPFTWLTTPDKYLLLLEGATHFSTIGSTGTEPIDLPTDVLGPETGVAREYTQSMSLAFLSTYLKGDTRYQPVLTSAFTTRFSRPEMPLSIISDLSTEQLERQLRATLESDQAFQQALDILVEQELTLLNQR
ncbi:MAG: alpha/beta fold hydrolase [Cyanobacteria bacterium P01_D01_bin.105]